MSTPHGLAEMMSQIAAQKAVLARSEQYTAALAAMLGGKQVKRADMQVVASVLFRAALDYQWMARRYADGRATYAVSMCNDNTRLLLALGAVIQPDKAHGDTVWATDGQFGLPEYALAPADDRQAFPESKFDGGDP